MKEFVLLMCLLLTGSSFAQEENHLKGAVKNEEISENSIKEVSQKRAQLEMLVAVYPNPSEGQLFIEGTAGSSVTIYSVEGTYVGTWVIGLDNKVEITDLPQGSFVCMIQEGNERVVKKIIVL